MRLCDRKLKQIDNGAFSTNALLNVMNNNQPIVDYNTELRQLLGRYAPIEYKTFVVKPLVPWFNDELKSLKLSHFGRNRHINAHDNNMNSSTRSLNLRIQG